MANLSKFYKPQTAWSYSAKIIHLFRIFAVAGLIFENPFGWVTRPSKPKLLPGIVLSLDQVNSLLNVPDIQSKTGIRHRAILEALYSSAVRLSEAANLELSDVDLERGTIIVRQGKGAKDRVVPLGDQAAQWLKKYLLKVRSLYKGASQAFWITHNGKPISTIGIRFIVKKAAKKVGLHVNPHTLRRSCATHLLQAGASPMMVKEILGHADLETLSRYLKLTLTELKHVHEQTHPRG
jgi:integrase/recombinase XerD